MHHALIVSVVGRRLATALGAVIVALAFAVALPHQAQAVTTVKGAWSKVDPRKVPGDPRGVVVRCAKPKTVSGAYAHGRGFNGYASVRMCLKYYRNRVGSYYYQGVLELKYHRSTSGGSDVFAGKSMSALGSTGMATGIRDCPRVSWSDGDVAWCYSPTQRFMGSGEKLYAKGYAIDPATRSHPVWSPVLTIGPPISIPGRPIARQEVLARSLSWIQRNVMYSQSRYTDGYRRDCSGYVSLSWHLKGSPSSSALRSSRYTSVIPKSDLQPGDALGRPGHIALFVRWAAPGRPVVREEYGYGHPAEERMWSARYAAANKAYRYHGIR